MWSAQWNEKGGRSNSRSVIHRCLQSCLDTASPAHMSWGPTTSGKHWPRATQGAWAHGPSPSAPPNPSCRSRVSPPGVPLARLIHRHNLKGRWGASIPALGVPVPGDPTLCSLPAGAGLRLGIPRGVTDLAQTPGTDRHCGSGWVCPPQPTLSLVVEELGEAGRRPKRAPTAVAAFENQPDEVP